MRSCCINAAFFRGAFLCCCFFVLTGGAGADDFILKIEGVKHSIVPILCGTFNDKQQFTIQQIEGTGFFVDPQGHFMTAGHVIHDLGVIAKEQPLPCVRAIYIPDNGWQREAQTINFHWFPIIHCDSDETLDLAVCQTSPIPGGVTPLSIKDIRPPDGTQVGFSGFPMGSIQPLSSRCDIATYRAVSDAEGSRDIVLDKGNWPGASGSPIYDESGSVIGILLQRGIADGTGMTVGRPSHFILQFLRKNGIVPIDKPDDQRKNKKN